MKGKAKQSQKKSGTSAGMMMPMMGNGKSKAMMMNQDEMSNYEKHVHQTFKKSK